MVKQEPVVIHAWSNAKKGMVQVVFYAYCVVNLVILGIYMAVTPEPVVKGPKPTVPSFMNRTSLNAAVDDYILKNGPSDVTTKFGPNITTWDVSKIQDFSDLFAVSRNPAMKTFNFNIGSWNVSNATSMSGMFSGAEAFDANLTKWNVNKVLSFKSMFMNAKAFKGTGLTGWKTTVATDFSMMFMDAVAFNADIPWDVSNATTISSMFEGAAAFTGAGVQSWATGKVKDMTSAFSGAVLFNADLTNWNVAGVTSMKKTFNGASAFLGTGADKWNVASVETMRYMFAKCALYNADLSAWITSKVMFFTGMFEDAVAFTGTGLEGWDTSSAIEMNFMFAGTTVFDADVTAWNVGNVKKFDAMFYNSGSFKGVGLGSWDIATDATKEGMFCNASDVNPFVALSISGGCGDGAFEGGDDDSVM